MVTSLVDGRVSILNVPVKSRSWHEAATVRSPAAGLKALFRPMTVMVPDLVLICENMLMAEGFIEAKVRTWSITAVSSYFGVGHAIALL